MKRGLLLATLAFGGVLALIVGFRLETAGLSVLVGVICGVLASLPVSLVLLWALARERDARQRLEEHRWEAQRPAPAAPPVLILNAGRESERLPQPPLLDMPAARNFVIVGEEEEQADPRRGAQPATRAGGDPARMTDTR